ncbi:protein kinase [Acetobacteraceae bacterium H6797]|nr:protein kinase [Acetobacteraceae bacterium H6797]
MAAPRLAAGSEIDGFTVGTLLHRGGMAGLWSVTHPDHPGPLLMKVPLLFEGEDPAAIVSFEMEQMILPRLSGQHVPRFIASGDFAVQPYLVMERIPGSSLLPKLQELPRPFEEVAHLGAAIATALADLHRQHVVHLDVKPSNILFRENGEAVLVDFGLSRHEQLPDLMEEEFRLPYGTAPYMAPEQVMGIRSEPRSDLFALGALLYFFTTGTRPFGDPQRMSGLKRRLWQDPAPPRALRPDCPPWLQEIILRCLEVDPERRHPTAAQLAFDLLNPESVTLTVRAGKLKRDGWAQTARRRFNPEAQVAFRRRGISQQLESAPIIAVAVDLDPRSQALNEALLESVRRLLPTMPGARLAFLNVLKQNRLAIDSDLDEQGRNKHLQRLVELRAFGAPLGLPDHRLTCHVLEAVNPASALLEFIRQNPVDHVVIGARADALRRRLLGSVSSAVAGEAPCSVTIIRPRIA